MDSKNPEPRNCLLYLASPPKFGVPEFAPALDAVLTVGGPRMGAFMLDMPGVLEAELKVTARALQPICAKHGVAFFLHNHVELAKELQADGVHLEPEHMPVKQARATLGDDVVLGVNCRNSSDDAMRVGDEGADYVSFGPFFGGGMRATAEILEWWQRYFILPCVASGGVTPENCAPLVKAGADFLAVGQSVWMHAQGPVAAIQSFDRAITEALQTP